MINIIFLVVIIVGILGIWDNFLDKNIVLYVGLCVLTIVCSVMLYLKIVSKGEEITKVVNVCSHYVVEHIVLEKKCDCKGKKDYKVVVIEECKKVCCEKESTEKGE